VRQECLDVALAEESLLGLWGGTTEVERREIRLGEWREDRASGIARENE